MKGNQFITVLLWLSPTPPARIANCELQRRKWVAVNGSIIANGPVIQTGAIYPQRLLEFYFQMFSSKQASDPEPTRPYYTTSHSCRAAVHGLVHGVTDESPVAEVMLWALRLTALILTELWVPGGSEGLAVALTLSLKFKRCCLHLHFWINPDLIRDTKVLTITCCVYLNEQKRKALGLGSCFSALCSTFDSIGSAAELT